MRSYAALTPASSPACVESIGILTWPEGSRGAQHQVSIVLAHPYTARYSPFPTHSSKVTILSLLYSVGGNAYARGTPPSHVGRTQLPSMLT